MAHPLLRGLFQSQHLPPYPVPTPTYPTWFMASGNCRACGGSTGRGWGTERGWNLAPLSSQFRNWSSRHGTSVHLVPPPLQTPPPLRLQEPPREPSEQCRGRPRPLPLSSFALPATPAPQYLFCSHSGLRGLWGGRGEQGVWDSS